MIFSDFNAENHLIFAFLSHFSGILHINLRPRYTAREQQALISALKKEKRAALAAPLSDRIIRG